MALNLLAAPVATTPTTFVAPIIAQTAALNIEQGLGAYVLGANIVDGAMIVVGGAVYVSSGTTAISGSASKYVKVTPSGATASAAFVANLSGVSWNAANKGYYDSFGNLYLFDELTAYINGAISTLSRRSVGLDGLSLAGTYGSQLITYTSPDTWTPPAGLYDFSGESSDLVWQIYSGSSWVGDTPVSGLCLCDGSTRRIYNKSASTDFTVYYRKLI